MSDTKQSSAERLRADFDAAFSEAPPPRVEGKTALLALRLAGKPYALRLEDVASLAPGRALLPVPNQTPGFLGLAGHRGSLWPAWDLGALLGLSPLKAEPRWLALASGSPPWAVAFEHFEGYLLAEPGDLRPVEGTPESAFVRETCVQGGLVRPVPRLDPLKDSIQNLLREPHRGAHGS